MKLEPKHYIIITDKFESINDADTFIVTKKIEYYLQASLRHNFVPIELRNIVLEYFGKDYGYAEYIIYTSLLKFKGMFNFLTFYKTDMPQISLKKKLLDFEFSLFDQQKKLIVHGIEVSESLLLIMYEKLVQSKIRFWKVKTNL
jgi:hypothetical protein